MNKFYLGINLRYNLYSFLPEGLNMMVSPAGYWKDGNWIKGHKFPRYSGSKFLDSGGFTLLNKYGDYPFSVEDYKRFIDWIKPDYYASMDYPCEPEISRKLSLLGNEDRIKATVNNALKMDKNDERMIPVIQGYELEEYIYCIDLYNKNNLIKDYMAVGSMCRRISNEQIHNLIPKIYDYTNKLGVTKLHFFGLKLHKDLIDLSKYIYSRDSAVSLDSYDKELRKKRAGRRFPKGQEEKKESFYSFLNRLEEMNLEYITK